MSLPQLLVVKRLFLEAKTYVARADPVSCGIAISMLQDAAELYIWTLIKERDVTIKERPDFGLNIESLIKTGVSVPLSAKLHELNKARISFKHYGNLPASDDAKKHETYVEDFLRTAMSEHFEVSFENLSLVDLVVDAGIKQYLLEADTLLEQDLLKECMEALAKAKATLFGRLSKYVPNVDTQLGDSDVLLGKLNNGRRAKSFTYLAQYLSVLRDALLVALLRLPHEDYKFLSSSLPTVVRTAGGMWHIFHTRSQYNEAECRRISACIVNLCIRLESLQTA